MPSYPEMEGTKRRSSVLVRGLSALELAINAGLVPGGTSVEQFMEYLRGNPGPPRWGTFIQGKLAAGEILGGYMAHGTELYTSVNFRAKALIAASGNTSIDIIDSSLTVLGTVSWAPGSTIGEGTLFPNPMVLEDFDDIYFRAPIDVSGSPQHILLEMTGSN